MTKLFAFITTIFISYHLTAQTCPIYGKTNDPKERKLNTNKNRSIDIDSSAEPEFVPLKNFLPTKPRVEKNLYKEGAYVYTEGYLTSAEEQGPETCNCGKASVSKKTGDVHMYLSLITTAPKKNSMVVEITPKFKKANPDYEQYLNTGVKIRVYGYLLYDYKHEGSAFTTCKKCRNIWRKTCWEVHPITQIEIVN